MTWTWDTGCELNVILPIMIILTSPYNSTFTGAGTNLHAVVRIVITLPTADVF